MSLTQVTGPYPIFTDLDGSPLDDGYLYIGDQNDDPETNPIQVYWDSALTIPATQPIRTNSGYAWRNGTPGLLYTAGAFSITIRNKRNEFVLYSPVGYGFDPAAVSASVVKNDFVGDGVEVDFTLSAAPSTILATNVFINGVYQEKDSYTLSGNVITFSVAPPLNSSIEIMTNETGVINSGNATAISYTLTAPGAVAQTVQTKLEQYVSVEDFGAVGDGVADDATAINNAIGAVEAAGGGRVYFPAGTFLVGATLALPDDVFLQGANQKATTIKLKAAANVNIIEKKAGALGFGAGLFDLTIDGNDTNNTNGGIYWAGASTDRGPTITIERVTVTKCRPIASPPSGEYGAIVTTGSTWGIMRDVDINQNQFAVGWWHKGSDWQIDNLYLGPNGASYNAGAGTQSMIIQGGAGNLYTSCYFGGNGGLDQVLLWGSQRNLFVNCINDNAWQCAYQFLALTGVGADGNRFIGGQISGASGRTNLGFPAVLCNDSDNNIFADVLWQGSTHTTSGNKADYGFEETGSSTGNGVIGGTLNVAFGTGFVNFGGSSTSLVSNIVGYDDSQMQIVVAKKRVNVTGPFDNVAPSTSSVPLLRLNGGGALSLWGGSYGYTSTWLQSIQDDGTNNLKELALNPLGGAVSVGGNGNGIKVVSPNGLVTRTISIDNSGNVVAV